MKFSLLVLFFISLTAQAEPFCIAHQGSFKNSPPNSLQSLQEALDVGAEGVEFDINHTQDGEAIIMHDGKLSTATHATGKRCPLDKKINELNLQEIRENCVLDFHNTQYPIPTLSEALALLHDSHKFVFIELKDMPSASTRKIIQQYFVSSPELLRVISFKVKYLDALIKSDNKSLFWSRVGGLDLDVAPWGTPKDYGVNVWNRLYRLRGKQYQKRESSVWTVNKQNRIRKYLKQNVDFITTDEVQMCLNLKSQML